MAYVSLSDLKTWMGITTTASDSLLQDALDAAQGFVEAQTGRVFESSTAAVATHSFDALQDVSADGRTLYLDADLAALSTATNGDGSAVAGDDLVTAPRNAAPYFALTISRAAGTVWSGGDGDDAIQIAGNWAYSLTPPAEVAHAVKVIAAQVFHQKDNASDADRIVSADGVVIVPSSIPRIAADVIRKYQRRTFN